MRPKSSTVEREFARIAGTSHGVVTRAELLAAGVTPGEIKHRLLSGALLRQHAGVYRVGHEAPSLEARYMAAVRAGGDGALLSGRAAAHLWRLVKGEAPTAEITTRTLRRIEGVRTRRCAHLSALDAAIYRSIPVTTVARTLVDIAAVLSVDALARACHEAGVLYRTTPADIEAVLARRPRSRGAGQLRRIMRGDVRVTLSKLETRFLELVSSDGLPLPETNRPAGGRRVDCRWPRHRLTVELDSYRFHNSRHAWEQDRRREREARGRGDDFRRYTYDDVFARPDLVLKELRTALDVQRVRFWSPDDRNAAR